MKLSSVKLQLSELLFLFNLSESREKVEFFDTDDSKNRNLHISYCSIMIFHSVVQIPKCSKRKILQPEICIFQKKFRWIMPHMMILCSMFQKLPTIVYGLGFDWILHSLHETPNYIANLVSDQLEDIIETMSQNRANTGGGDVKIVFITIPEVSMSDRFLLGMRIIFAIFGTLRCSKILGPFLSYLPQI